jgi:hypothetical protein
MAAEYFNSIGGFSVGLPEVPVIDANGNVITNVLTNGNVFANVVYATYYKWANGNPFTGTAGGNNTQLQYNNNGTPSGIPNVTYNGSNLSLGNVANIKIGGGTFGYYLQTDGAGNLQWSPGGGGNGGGTPGGSNTTIQFNNAGNFGGDTDFTYNNLTQIVTAPNLTVTGTLLASIPGNQITGAVSFATTANAVAGANVSGAVSFATTANAVAGANVFGAVNYATIANSITGANVSGAVQFATVANSVAGANVSGQVNFAGTANSVAGANVSGQVNFAATANSVAGSNVVGAVTALDAIVDDVKIYGGADGYVLQTDGIGNLSWTAQTGNGGNGIPGGANTQVQFNNAGSFGGAAGFTFNSVNNILTVPTANVTTQLIATNANVTNLLRATTANVTTLNATGTVTAVNLAGRLTTNSQPNITSVGTLTGINISGPVNLGAVGNVTITGGVNGYVLGTDGAGNLNWVETVSQPGGTNQQIQFNNNDTFEGIPTATWDGSIFALGDVTQVSIGGGSPDYVLATDGSGNLTWVSGSSGTPGGSNTQVQYNNNGNFAGSSGFTFNSSTNVLTVPNVTVSGSAIIGGNANISGNTRAVNLTVTSRANLGAVGNVTITGGTFGQYLRTNGAGVLTWANVTGGNATPGGDDTQVQFNSSGEFAGSPFLTFNTSTDTLTVGGNLIANTVIMGSGAFRFSYSNVYAATTSSAAADQVIYSVPAEGIAGIDFTVISTDNFNLSRQISKLTCVVIDGSLNYTDISTNAVNNYLSEFSMAYNAGNIIVPAAIELKVTPSVSTLVTYKMQVTTYEE